MSSCFLGKKNGFKNRSLNEFIRYVWFDLVSLFNGISTFVGYLILKIFSKKNSSCTIEHIARRIREFIPFPTVFCQKVNVVERQSLTTIPQSIALTITPPVCMCVCFV